MAKRIGESPIVCCASRRYLERRGVPRNMAELLRHRLVASDRSTDSHSRIAENATALGMNPDTVRVAFRSDDPSARFAAVSAGLGIGFLSAYHVRRATHMVVLPIPIDVPALPLWLVVHREIRTVPRIRAVYDRLGAALVETLR